MTNLYITAWAPDRETAIAFMRAVGIAEIDTETGCIYPTVDAHIHPFRPTETISVVRPDMDPVPGWHCNVVYYGATAATLTDGLDQSAIDLFERTRILDMVDARTGEAPQWIALSDDSVPPGYQTTSGVRLFDPALISSRSCKWVGK